MTDQASALESFLHHSDDPAGKEYTTLSAQRAKMRAIQNFHMDGRGWSDIGYHFVVFQWLGKKDVRISPRAFAARPVHKVPAAQLNHNTRTLAICVVGNGVRELLAPETEKLIGDLIRKYGPDVTTIGGHGDVTQTTCPGALFRKSLPDIARHAGIRVRGH